IRSGESASWSLAAVTVPPTGAYRSLAAFTDSIVPNFSPALRTVPTAGSSTKITSPSSDCAWSLMPTVAVPPSTCTHSWLSEKRYWLRSGTHSPPFGSFVERQRHHLRRRRGSAYVNGDIVLTTEVGAHRRGGHGG